MARVRSLAFVCTLASLSLTAREVPAQEGTASPVTVYSASFFASIQPASAFDMLAVLPGYDFRDSDADVRGFADP